MGLLDGLPDLTAVSKTRAQSWVLLVVVWWLNNARASFPEILLLRGLKVTTTASATSSSPKAGKRRSSRGGHTYSFSKHMLSDHSLPDPGMVGIGIWL